MKLARHATGRPGIVVSKARSTGVTAQTMAMTTSKNTYRKHYQPLPAGVFFAPYPYWYRYGWDPETTSRGGSLKRAAPLAGKPDSSLRDRGDRHRAVLGEGGYVVSAGLVFCADCVSLATSTASCSLRTR